MAFGPYVKYGQIIKDYRNADQPGRYAPPEMAATERKGIFGIRESEERTICTSHVERHNLTIRTLMKRFTRLSLGFSKKLENLEAACAMFLAYYNFVWRTRDEENGQTRLPAAIAAGATDRLMSFENLFDAVTGQRGQAKTVARSTPAAIMGFSAAEETRQTSLRGDHSRGGCPTWNSNASSRHSSSSWKNWWTTITVPGSRSTSSATSTRSASPAWPSSAPFSHG
jgi:hypothetical protein